MKLKKTELKCTRFFVVLNGLGKKKYGKDTIAADILCTPFDRLRYLWEKIPKQYVLECTGRDVFTNPCKRGMMVNMVPSNSMDSRGWEGIIINFNFLKIKVYFPRIERTLIFPRENTDVLFDGTPVYLCHAIDTGKIYTTN